MQTQFQDKRTHHTDILSITCQVTLGISESPIDFQWGSQKYSG